MRYLLAVCSLVLGCSGNDPSPPAPDEPAQQESDAGITETDAAAPDAQTWPDVVFTYDASPDPPVDAANAECVTGASRVCRVCVCVGGDCTCGPEGLEYCLDGLTDEWSECFTAEATP